MVRVFVFGTIGCWFESGQVFKSPKKISFFLHFFILWKEMYKAPLMIRLKVNSAVALLYIRLTTPPLGGVVGFKGVGLTGLCAALIGPPYLCFNIEP